MCKRKQCEQCQKVTYTGCGKHLEHVFRGIAERDRCTCRELANAAVALIAQVSAEPSSVYA